mgnify:CR=1 FL=1
MAEGCAGDFQESAVAAQAGRCWAEQQQQCFVQAVQFSPPSICLSFAGRRLGQAARQALSQTHLCAGCGAVRRKRLPRPAHPAAPPTLPHNKLAPLGVPAVHAGMGARTKRRSREKHGVPDNTAAAFSVIECARISRHAVHTESAALAGEGKACTGPPTQQRPAHLPRYALLCKVPLNSRQLLLKHSASAAGVQAGCHLRHACEEP